MSDQHEPESTFDPRRFVTRVGGADYLEVKWRVYWLRTQHPNAVMETELVSHVNDVAVFKARVSIPGGGTATGWGSEGYDDFRDYLEKAETKALGRALAALGFGTQFAPDHEFGASNGEVVDAPVRREQRQADRGSQAAGRPGEATERQWGFLRQMASERGMGDDAAIQRWVDGHPTLRDIQLSRLTRQQASAIIEVMKATPAPQRGRAVAVNDLAGLPPVDEPDY